jgi:mRNA-degrading endonuclease toxin of MazEF toxin-antitoxin module
MSSSVSSEKSICQEAVESIENFLIDLECSPKESDNKKAKTLSYWIKDYIRFIDYEKNFKPTTLKRYERGDVLKIHLGYRIGSEEGGLHYAVVLDKNNNISSPVLTVIPLTSLKKDNKVYPDDVMLGTELKDTLIIKAHKGIEKISSKMKEHNLILKELKNLKEGLISNVNEEIEKVEKEQKELKRELNILSKVIKEAEKMKNGSIALINQITTISKIRIYDPKSQYDVLSGIKISPENLDLINDKIIKLFLKI